MRRFFHDLSPESRRRRFFTAGEPADILVDRLCDSADEQRSVTLVAVRQVGDDTRFIAVGSYIAGAPGVAEAAFAVDDRFQGKGLGTELLERLAAIAVVHGFRRFEATTLADNTAMLEVFRDSGFEVRSKSAAGCIEVALTLTASAEGVVSAEARRRRATAASLRPMLEPKAVAVIGASRDPAGIGRRILDALVAAGFTGPIYPVNPSAGELAGLRTYASVRDVPAGVDLGVDRRAARSRDDGGRRVRRRRREVARRDHRGLRGGRRRRARAAAGARRARARVRDADGRSQLHGAAERQARDVPQRVVLADLSAAWARRALVAERRPRPRDSRARIEPRRRPLDVRQRGQQGRRVEQRSARVLGGGRGDARHPAVPRVVRQPAPLRASRAADRAHQADRRGEGRTHARWIARRRQPHRGPRRQRRGGRRAVPPVGRDPRRHDRRDVRHRVVPRRAAAARGTPRRDRHQRRRPGHPRGRRLRVVGPDGTAVLGRHPRKPLGVPAAGRQHGQPGRHGRVRRARGVPAGHRSRARRQGYRRAHRHLRAGRREAGGADRRRDSRGDRQRAPRGRHAEADHGVRDGRPWTAATARRRQRAHSRLCVSRKRRARARQGGGVRRMAHRAARPSLGIRRRPRRRRADHLPRRDRGARRGLAHRRGDAPRALRVRTADRRQRRRAHGRRRGGARRGARIPGRGQDPVAQGAAQDRDRRRAPQPRRTRRRSGARSTTSWRGRRRPASSTPWTACSSSRC